MRAITPPPATQARIRLDRRATIRTSRGLRVVVRAVSLSPSAIGIIYSAPAEVGAKLEIEMGLPLNTRLEPLKIYGIVTHSHLQGSEYYTILKLADPSDKDRELIKRFIKAREKARRSNS